jgi:hypothetical protein
MTDPIPAEIIAAATEAIHYEGLPGSRTCSCQSAEEHDVAMHDDRAAAIRGLEAAAPLLHAAEPPDEEFPASWPGGHALVIEFGDEEFIARCQCGIPFGARNPASSLDLWQQPWERHVMRRNQP